MIQLGQMFVKFVDSHSPVTVEFQSIIVFMGEGGTYFFTFAACKKMLDTITNI